MQNCNQSPENPWWPGQRGGMCRPQPGRLPACSAEPPPWPPPHRKGSRCQWPGRLPGRCTWAPSPNDDSLAGFSGCFDKAESPVAPEPCYSTGAPCRMRLSPKRNCWEDKSRWLSSLLSHCGPPHAGLAATRQGPPATPNLPSTGQ